jgi:hypothetical protein
MRRPLRARLLLTLAGVAVLSAVAPWVRGESSFFRVAPGPLSESHAELDTSESCAKCHEPNQGVTNAKCLDCHKVLRNRMAKKLGLHATFSGRCIQCHPGHKGRTTSIIDWNHVGGQQTFKHDLTEFPLTNQHAQLACTACHTKRMKSGRLSYLGLQSDCQSCHKGVHRFSKPDLVKQCDACHPAGKANKGMRLSEWSDQHYARTKLLFLGKHAELVCTKCHPKGDMAGRTPPRSCMDCHRPNHPTPASLGDCTQCHKAGQPWKEANVDHRRFGFALLGKHAKLDCKRCHPRGFEPSYSDNGCANCHQHRDVHKRQFADKRCDACHIEGGKRTLPFDHNKDTRYALLGFHAEPAVRNKCASCHPQGIYRTDKLQCTSCHQDKHKGQSGNECTKCHSVTQRWKDARYAKPHTKFPLEGLHRKVKCQSCHPASKYQLGDVGCIDCHAKTDPHQGKLGTACEKCHIPARGAPKFNHERMTNFVRLGAHLKVDCVFCHQPRPERPPPAGWTRTTHPPSLDRKFPVMGKRCADCHEDPHKGASGPDCQRCHGTSTFDVLSADARRVRPIDHNGGWLGKHATLPFDDNDLAAEGRACGRCHGAPTCDRCHRTSPPRSHTAAWRLRGHGVAAAFDSEGCRTCHLTGTCVECHRTTRPLNHRGAWSTLHGYAAGTFADNNCYVCHSRGECQGCHERK